MKKILVVNVNWLGDAIFSTPLFAALKKAYPGAEIKCFCVPRVREVLRYCPYIDEIIVYDEKGRDRFFWNKLRLILRLRREKFDAAFVLHRSMTRGLLVYLAGIPIRVGYGKFKGLLTHPVKLPGDGLHRSDHYLRVAQDYGIPCLDRRCQLRLTEAEIRNMGQTLKKQGVGPEDRVIVFNTGGNWDLKRWPIASWVQLTRQVAGIQNVKIIFSGAVKDVRDAEEIIAASGVGAINFAGQTSLGESLALYHRSAVVISGDSGPLHLASSIGANVIGIFGPTRQEVTGPRGVGQSVVLFSEVGCNKAPCYHLSCKDNLCMQAIGAHDVFEAIQKFIR